jgi:DNA adenine methylase
VKSVLKYPGAKWVLADWVISHFPPTNHYVEPYFGSGAVLLSKTPSPHEVVNDLNGEVVNLFRMIRDRGAELAARVEMTPWAREEYTAYGEDSASADPIEQARMFLVRCWQAHGSRIGNRSGWKHSGNSLVCPVRLWQQVPARILAVVERLRCVEIECLPALTITGRYSTPDTLIYADPPYPYQARSDRARGRKMYRHELTNADHLALLDALDAHPGPVVLSGYHCPLYDNRLPHWHTVERRAQAEKANVRIEVLWLNDKAADTRQLRML